MSEFYCEFERSLLEYEEKNRQQDNFEKCEARILEEARNREAIGNFEGASELYKRAGKFGDYLRCMDNALKEAEKERDYNRAAKIAKQIASEDVAETYKRLANLKEIGFNI